MALALSREKRFNAGNRMSRMLQEEEQDEFYATTYGGFEELSGDEEYSSEESESDATDSDISESENDEPISDDEGKETKRQRRTVTKAYKEPASKPAPKKHSQPRPSAPAPKPKERPSKRDDSQPQPEPAGGQDEGNLRKSSRRSTIIKGTEFQIRLKEREERAEINRLSIANRYRPEVRRLTQEELLEEAALTEEKNLISLKMYHQLEAEKKKTKSHKKAFKGPYIRYHSMTMPANTKDKAGKTRTSTEETSATDNDSQALPPAQRWSRNFITFSEETHFKECFPKTKSRPPTKPLCPVTRQRARYLDPITNIPYANRVAFKRIREAYESELESQSDSKRRRTKAT